jgi:integrase
MRERIPNRVELSQRRTVMFSDYSQTDCEIYLQRCRQSAHFKRVRGSERLADSQVEHLHYRLVSFNRKSELVGILDERVKVRHRPARLGLVRGHSLSLSLSLSSSQTAPLSGVELGARIRRGRSEIQLQLGHLDLAFTRRVYVHMDADDGPDPSLLVLDFGASMPR